MEGRLIHVNGRLLPESAAHLSALDRGFTLGDGVFETLRVVAGRPFRWSDHLRRLARSAAALALPLPVPASGLEEAIRAVLDANALAEAVVRITLSRGVPADRGLLPPESPSPTLVLQALPFHGYPEERYRRGFAAATSRIRRNESSPLSRIKSCNYLDSVLARVEALRQGADEALLLNGAGDVACGASSNLFVLSGGVLVTPSPDCGVLEGVTRRAVLELAGGLGLRSAERRLAPREVAEAEEAFLTNSVLGVMPLVSLDGHALGGGAPGPITLRLRVTYMEILHRAP